jgi:rSAM/selenodomain-associated transferase 1
MRAKSCSPCSIFHHSPLTARSPESTSRLRRAPIPAIAVFARAPVAGQAKTRLIPRLGSQGAARFQAALISDTLRKVAGLRRWVQPYLFLAASPITFGRSHAEAILHEQPLAGAGISGFSVIRQQGKDLGERLENAFRRLLRFHPSCVVIGTDSPLLPARILRQALGELRACESVLGPCPDGGYYLIALRRPVDPGRLRSIFRRVRWSTTCAFSDTLRNLLRQGLSCSVLEACADVDLPRDLQRLKEDMFQNPKARRLAPATWNFLKRM